MEGPEIYAKGSWFRILILFGSQLGLFADVFVKVLDGFGYCLIRRSILSLQMLASLQT
jgi:hypothetical protein